MSSATEYKKLCKKLLLLMSSMVLQELLDQGSKYRLHSVAHLAVIGTQLIVMIVILTHITSPKMIEAPQICFRLRMKLLRLLLNGPDHVVLRVLLSGELYIEAPQEHEVDLVVLVV